MLFVSLMTSKRFGCRCKITMPAKYPNWTERDAWAHTQHFGCSFYRFYESHFVPWADGDAKVECDTLHKEWQCIALCEYRSRQQQQQQSNAFDISLSENSIISHCQASLRHSVYSIAAAVVVAVAAATTFTAVSKYSKHLSYKKTHTLAALKPLWLLITHSVVRCAFVCHVQVGCGCGNETQTPRQILCRDSFMPPPHTMRNVLEKDGTRLTHTWHSRVRAAWRKKMNRLMKNSIIIVEKLYCLNWERPVHCATDSEGFSYAVKSRARARCLTIPIIQRWGNGFRLT